MQKLTNKQVDSNIKKYYIYKALYGVLLPSAFFTIFMVSKGLSYAEIGLTESVFGIAMLFEIFGGAFSDLVGRKITTFIYTLVVAISCGLYLISNTFWDFALLNFIWGIGLAIGAGADNALIYDSLKDVGRAKEFIKIFGRARMFFLISGMLGIIAGSYLYAINEKLPFLIGPVFFVLSGFVFLSMHERRIKHNYSIKNHYLQIKKGAYYVLFHKNIRWVVLYGMLATVCFSFFGMIQTPFILSAGFKMTDLGWIAALVIAMEALFSYSAEYLHRLFCEKTCFKLILAGKVLSLAGFSYFTGVKILPLFLMQKFSSGFGMTFAEHYLQKHAESKIRATVAAVEGFAFDISLILSTPIWGYLSDVYSIQITFLLMSVFIFLFGGLLMIRFPLHRHKFEW